jgi:hypothetical protein
MMVKKGGAGRGLLHTSDGKGFTSFAWIRKPRLVLPLFVRDRLNIKPRDQILLSFSSVSGTDGKLILVLAKAPENSSGLAFSKNVKSMR